MAEGVADVLRERHFLKHGEKRYGGAEDAAAAAPAPKLLEKQQLHDGLGFGQYMLAGSVAGMVEHMAMFPVDLVKTRMQMLQSAGGSAHSAVYKAFFAIMKKEGPLGLYRGIGAMGLGAGPAHAVYFAAYETLKERFGGNKSGYHPVAHAFAGAGATIASDAVFTPMDVVKQRLQLRHSPYSSVLDCIRKTMKEEGFSAFYKSYRTTVVMNIPFTAVHFAAYEAGKKVYTSSWMLMWKLNWKFVFYGFRTLLSWFLSIGGWQT
jgi:solute carrier family 25 iron transporter 28/37